MDVVVYSSSWCRDCRAAKRFLESHGIAYSEIDIEKINGGSIKLILATESSVLNCKSGAASLTC